MKIGILVGRVPPPVFINHLLCGLAEAGHKVFLYGSLHDKNFRYNKPLIFVRTKPQNKIFLLFNAFFLIFKIIINSQRNALWILSQIKSQEIGVRNFLNRCNNVLPPFLDDLDIFHIQWAKSLVNYPEFIEKLKCPVVLSLRGAHINYSPLADKNLSERYRQYFPSITGFHAVSDAITREAEKYAADPKIITVIRPAVNNSLFKILPSSKTFNSKPVLKIISVGRCHWKKGYTLALDTMNGLKEQGIKFHYTIIAGGKDQENINYQIQDLSLNEFVSFINELPHEKVIKMIAASDLFLLSSVEEGISNAVLEAMALGIPVISSDCGGMTEVINNGVNGFIAPVRDTKALQQTIEDFIGIEKKNKLKIISNAQKTIRENFLLDKQIDNMISFYHNSMSKSIHSQI